MAHFAQLDETNKVLQVIVVHNNELLDENGVEQEEKGILFCQNLLGGTWLQTSYNKNFRKHFAGIDYTYDPILDAFIPPQPFDSWTLNEETCEWEPPVPMPHPQANWNEKEGNWEFPFWYNPD